MTFPDRLLRPGEVVRLDIRPHPVIFAAPCAWLVLAAAAFVVAIAVGLPMIVGWAVFGTGVLGLVVLFGSRYLRWSRTLFVLTDQRILVQAGVVRRRIIHIPLEEIAGIAVRQSIGERAWGSGIIAIEAEADGEVESERNRFRFVRDPDAVQRAVYLEMMAAWQRPATHAAIPVGVPPTGVQAAAGSPDALLLISQLAALRERGLLTDGEFEEKKADLLRRL